MLGQRDAGQHDLEPRAGWLVHLAEDQAHLVQEPGLLQFVVQLVPFTNPLADAGEDARSLMSLDDIVDELQGQEALAQCGAAENARLAAFDHRIQEVDDLDAGLQNLVCRLLLEKKKKKDQEKQKINNYIKNTSIDFRYCIMHHILIYMFII